MRGEGVAVAAERNWPSTWRRVTLAEAGQWLSGGTPSTSNEAFWGGDIPWISAASLKGFHLTDSDRRLTRLGAANGSRLVPRGTTLFVVRGMSLKSEFRIGVAERELAFGQDCKAIIPADGIDPYFLAYAIRVRTPEILSMVEETSHGTGRLDTARLQTLEIGVPSLEEQLRIVAAQSVIERRISALERLIDKLDITASSLVDGRLAGVKSFIPLRCLLDDIEVGVSVTGESRPPADGEWGVIRLSAVTSGEFDTRQAKRLPPGAVCRASMAISAGDVLMVRVNGSTSLVGLACVVREAAPRLLLSDLVFRLVPMRRALSGEFLGLILNSSFVRRQIRSAIRGTSGQFQLPQSEVGEILVPEVPLAEQLKVASALLGSRRRANALRAQLGKLRMIGEGISLDLLNASGFEC